MVNVFDALIVVLGLIEICLIQLLDSSSTSLKILSIFRVLRVIRILRSLKFMKTVINVMKRSLKSIFYISLLLFLFLFIYALLGMNLFSGSFTNKKIPYRQNFDSYNNAFISVFQILTQSTWQYILYLTMNTDVNKFISCFYLISWILIGNYLFLNLFLAILLDEFYKESQKLTKNREDDIEENNFKERIESIEKEIDKVRDITIKEKISKETSFLKNSKEIFSLNKYCKNIIEMKHFGHFMQFLILLSSISLIIDTYIIEGNIKYILVISDGIINFCFFSEFLLKIVAEGLIYNKNSYFRDSWNIMDFFILIASVLSTIREIVNFPSNKVIF